MHVALVMLRLGHAGPDGEALSRSISEVFVADMDDNMREIGIGDLAVPRKVKRAAAALYDRYREFGNALLAADRDHLSRSIAEMIGVGARADHLDVAALAHYCEKVSVALSEATDADCVAGQLRLPPAIDALPAFGA